MSNPLGIIDNMPSGIYKRTQQHRDNLGKTMRGKKIKPHSEVHRIKIRESMKKYWLDKKSRNSLRHEYGM